MTVEADLAGEEKFLGFGGMRVVATGAHSRLNRRVGGFVPEHSPVMAFKTYIAGRQKLCFIGRMGIVAARTHSPGHRRMGRTLLKL
jgi:hypothetical protein